MLWLWCLLIARLYGNPILVKWDFQQNFEGWGKSNAEEMGMEVSVGNELRGKVINNQPYIDSPPLALKVMDREYFVFRMLYHGTCTMGQVLVSDAKLHEEGSFSEDGIRINFKVIADGGYHIYYIPVHESIDSTIYNVRVYPCVRSTLHGKGPVLGDMVYLDWILFGQAPVVEQVTGCLDVYYTSSDRKQPKLELNTTISRTNGYHETYSSKKLHSALPYATTYNCLVQGGERIKIAGRYFGEKQVTVTIDGKECTHLVQSEDKIECTLPMGDFGMAQVAVHNGQYHGLFANDSYLAYSEIPSAPTGVFVSNVAAHALDVNWKAPGTLLQVQAITGYQLIVRSTTTQTTKSIDVGNVTSTTITGLDANHVYAVKVAAVVENQHFQDWKNIDLYGYRPRLNHALFGPYTIEVLAPETLSNDFAFTKFDASRTRNLSSLYDPHTLGPTGEIGGQGHYGLYVVGEANVQNCNTSVVCCDGYDSPAGCGHACNAVGSMTAKYTLNGSDRGVRTNAPGQDPYYRVTFDHYSNITKVPTASCGPALRLTGSHSQLIGAAWYPRRMNVREGFDTTFTFRISNPSFSCRFMDEVHTHCRSRGGDGFAFVVQSLNEAALGFGGMELGYGGINNSLAIEFDTQYNYEQSDAYENHISVQSRGWRHPNSANHRYSLGSTVNIADLTSGQHKVRISYSPIFETDSIFMDAFDATPHTSYFLSNADFPYGGQADWSTGMGTLKVYVDDMATPKLVVPLNLDATLKLHHGRAWVGFTAATGTKSWQNQDIMDWSFDSMRQTVPFSPPPLVNQEGAHKCRNKTVCVHM